MMRSGGITVGLVSSVRDDSDTVLAISPRTPIGDETLYKLDNHAPTPRTNRAHG